MHHDGYGTQEPAFSCPWEGCPVRSNDADEIESHVEAHDREELRRYFGGVPDPAFEPVRGEGRRLFTGPAAFPRPDTGPEARGEGRTGP